MTGETHLKKTPQNFLSTDLDGELILVHGQSGAFYSIKDSGLAIWRAFDETESLAEVADKICDEFEIEPADCEAEVLDFSRKLVSAGFATFH